MVKIQKGVLQLINKATRIIHYIKKRAARMQRV